MYPGLHGRKILWLDGHYSEGVTARGQKNTPILEEIGALRGTDPDQVIVLIDDIRLFTKASDAVSGHDSVLGYPTLIEIYAKLLEVSPEFELYVIEDVAIGFSRAHPVTVTPLVRACTVSRFADEAGFAPADITASEQTIMHASGTELAAIESLPEDFLATEKLGFGYHYRYCLALTLLGRGQHAKALLEFARIFGMGYRSSRIELHIADAAQRSGDPQLVDWATQLISAARDDVRNDVARQ